MGARVSAGLAIAVLALAAALALTLLRPGGHGAAPAEGRTVLVAAGGATLPTTSFYALRDCLGNPTTCVNGAEGLVLTYAVAGSPPVGRQPATVLTDSNCEPDRYGVSHCLNRLRLASGRELTVRHDHNMGNDPCVSPGEKVVVRSV